MLPWVGPPGRSRCSGLWVPTGGAEMSASASVKASYGTLLAAIQSKTEPSTGRPVSITPCGCEATVL